MNYYTSVGPSTFVKLTMLANVIYLSFLQATATSTRELGWTRTAWEGSPGPSSSPRARRWSTRRRRWTRRTRRWTRTRWRRWWTAWRRRRGKGEGRKGRPPMPMATGCSTCTGSRPRLWDSVLHISSLRRVRRDAETESETESEVRSRDFSEEKHIRSSSLGRWTHWDYRWCFYFSGSGAGGHWNSGVGDQGGQSHWCPVQARRPGQGGGESSQLLNDNDQDDYDDICPGGRQPDLSRGALPWHGCLRRGTHHLSHSLFHFIISNLISFNSVLGHHQLPHAPCYCVHHHHLPVAQVFPLWCFPQKTFWYLQDTSDWQEEPVVGVAYKASHILVKHILSHVSRLPDDVSRRGIFEQT